MMTQYYAIPDQVIMTQYYAILDPVRMTQPQINNDESSTETVSPEI